jgi:hypothetical protein
MTKAGIGRGVEGGRIKSVSFECMIHVLTDYVRSSY